MGERGREETHGFINELKVRVRGIVDPEQKIRVLMKEQLTIVSPRVKATMPTHKRQKKQHWIGQLPWTVHQSDSQTLSTVISCQFTTTALIWFYCKIGRRKKERKREEKKKERETETEREKAQEEEEKEKMFKPFKWLFFLSLLMLGRAENYDSQTLYCQSGHTFRAVLLCVL